jgi:hypothetical protein
METSDSEDEKFDDARSTRSTRRSSSSRDYTRTSFDYSHLSFNHPSGSSHIGKIPQFDGIGYSKWKNSMGGVFDGGKSRTLDYCEQGYYIS